MTLSLGQEEYIENVGDGAGAVAVIHPQTRFPFPEDEGILLLPGHINSIGTREVIVLIYQKPCLSAALFMIWYTILGTARVLYNFNAVCCMTVHDFITFVLRSRYLDWVVFMATVPIRANVKIISTSMKNYTVTPNTVQRYVTILFTKHVVSTRSYCTFVGLLIYLIDVLM